MKSRREGCFMTLLFGRHGVPDGTPLSIQGYLQLRSCMIGRSMGAQEGNTRCKGHQVDTMKTPSFPLFSRFPWVMSTFTVIVFNLSPFAC